MPNSVVHLEPNYNTYTETKGKESNPRVGPLAWVLKVSWPDPKANNALDPST